MLGGRSVSRVRLTAGERPGPGNPILRLRVLAALTSNISLNAARTIATDADQNINALITTQITLGLAGLLASLALGFGLIAATRRQTAHFRSLVTASTDLVLVFGAGGCRYASESVTRMLGCGDSDLLGKGFLPFIHSDDRAEVQEVCAHGVPQEVGVPSSRSVWRVATPRSARHRSAR